MAVCTVSSAVVKFGCRLWFVVLWFATGAVRCAHGRTRRRGFLVAISGSEWWPIHCRCTRVVHGGRGAAAQHSGADDRSEERRGSGDAACRRTACCRGSPLVVEDGRVRGVASTLSSRPFHCAGLLSHSTVPSVRSATPLCPFERLRRKNMAAPPLLSAGPLCRGCSAAPRWPRSCLQGG